jgi:hypothetical protein
MANGEIVLPWWWKRAENSSIFLFTGAIPIVGLIEGMDPVLQRNLTLVVLPLIVLCVKAFGMFVDPAAKPTTQEEKRELAATVQKLEEKWTGDRAETKKQTE